MPMRAGPCCLFLGSFKPAQLLDMLVGISWSSGLQRLRRLYQGFRELVKALRNSPVADKHWSAYSRYGCDELSTKVKASAAPNSPPPPI